MQAFLAAFTLFGPSHLSALAVIVILSAALVLGARCSGSETITRRIALALATLLILNKILVYSTIFMIEDLNWTHALPMHMCDW